MSSGSPSPLELAYRYINRRERTVAEVREHLARHGVESAPAQEVIGELRATGALDDARFARLFAEDKRALEQWGSERIRRGLDARGVDRDLIEDALIGAGVAAGDAEAGDKPETDLDRALGVLRSRFAVPPRERRDRERALGVLLRKGYEYELALDALARHCSACE